MSCVLGVDFSSHAVDLVLLDETSDVASWTWVDLFGTRAFDRTRAVPLAMPSAGWFDDRGVYLAAIEKPMGYASRLGQSVLMRIQGAVVASIPHRLELWEMSPQEWRAGVALKGNASKQDVADAVAALRGPAGEWPQDALDAYAIAYAAREINRRAVDARRAA